MSLKLQVPPKTENLRPTITVIGVGGAGGNAVNNMIASKLEGVRFVAANTDAQALENSLAETRIQLGLTVTQGLGAGALPDTGRIAADEALDEIEEALSGSHMAFVTAGMGGGTGTGAAPVIAKKAREMNILTVGVVTRPFHFEGSHRMRIADMGIEELQSYVDTLIVIPNQNLFRIANEKTTFADAFSMADNVLHSGVRGVTDLMIMPGLINLDFADIRAVMSEMGKAMMGTGEAEGDRRALDAAEAAISNPLLDDVSMKGARGMLINITGGPDMTLFEVDEAANRVREEVDPNANIIFGATFNDALAGKMRVSIVATGIDVVENTRAKPSGSGNFASASSFNFNKPRKPASEMAHAASEESVLKRPAPLKIEPRRPAAEAPSQAPSLDLGNMTTASVEADAEPEVADRDDEDSFSPPKPVEPNVRSTSHARVAESFTKTVEEPVAAAPKERARPEASSFSLIQKLTNRAKSRDKERETVATESPEEAEIRDTSPKRKAAAEEEYLDIPAFLRRQAN